MHDGGKGIGTKGKLCRAGADEQDRSGSRRVDAHCHAEPSVDDDAVGEDGSDGDCRPVCAGHMHMS